ncbi:MAG: metal-dependent hydrolase, partial [Halobacteriaceae archaeon]
KTLHNVFVLAVCVGYVAVFDNLKWVWLGVLTHFILDVIGSKRGIAFFYPVWDREFGMPAGVTTSSRWAGIVTTVVTLIELSIIGLLVHFGPTIPLSGFEQVFALI